MDRTQRLPWYRILFFLFCAADLVFLSAFILYFGEPGRSAPATDFITVMTVSAGLGTVPAAGVFYCLLMMIRLQRDGGDGDDLLAIPPKTLRVPQREETSVSPLSFAPSSPRYFERILRMLIMFVVVTGVIFILFLAAVLFTSN